MGDEGDRLLPVLKSARPPSDLPANERWRFRTRGCDTASAWRRSGGARTAATPSPRGVPGSAEAIRRSQPVVPSLPRTGQPGVPTAPMRPTQCAAPTTPDPAQNVSHLRAAVHSGPKRSELLSPLVPGARDTSPAGPVLDSGSPGVYAMQNIGHEDSAKGSASCGER